MNKKESNPPPKGIVRPAPPPAPPRSATVISLRDAREKKERKKRIEINRSILKRPRCT